MSIELPKFDKGYCIALTACGRLKSIDHSQKKKHKDDEKITRYRTSKGMAFLRVCRSGKKMDHLHIDSVLPILFRGTFQPKSNCKKAEGLEVIKSVFTTEIESSITAHFDVPLLELPSNGMIRSLSGEQKSVDMSFKLTTAELNITGAPFDRIRWNIFKKEGINFVRILMRGHQSFIVSEKYLSECWDWINKQFSIFMFGRRKDENS